MNDFNKFMNIYPIGEKLVDSSAEYYILLKQLASQISSFYGNKYLVKFSCGQGNLSEVPWICIFNPTITNKAEKGLYISILFKSDMTGFYLELGQGMQYFKTTFGSNSLEYLDKVAKYFRNQITTGKFELHSIDLNVKKGTRGEGYEFGTVIAKYYEKQTFNILEFKKDLDDILLIYDGLIDNMSSTSYDEIISSVINEVDVPLDYINETNQKIEQELLKESGLDFGDIKSLVEVAIPNQKKKLTKETQKSIRKIDNIKKAKKDMEIGLIGEELVIEYEKQKMIDNNRPDLVDKVIWESRVNDILGYDIRSYDFDENGNEYEIYIEVKSTETNEKNVFFISKNEYDKMSLFKNKYWIYRVSNNKHIFYKINYELFQEKFDIEVNNYLVSLKEQ